MRNFGPVCTGLILTCGKDTQVNGSLWRGEEDILDEHVETRGTSALHKSCLWCLWQEGWRRRRSIILLAARYILTRGSQDAGIWIVGPLSLLMELKKAIIAKIRLKFVSMGHWSWGILGPNLLLISMISTFTLVKWILSNSPGPHPQWDNRVTAILGYLSRQ